MAADTLPQTEAIQRGAAGNGRPSPLTNALPARNDVAVFRAALAVVAVAVADDAYIHPEPGVAAADHLVSGLVPLACVAVLIWTAARLPSLLRGWIAIAAGIHPATT